MFDQDRISLTCFPFDYVDSYVKNKHNQKLTDVDRKPPKRPKKVL